MRFLYRVHLVTLLILEIDNPILPQRQYLFFIIKSGCLDPDHIPFVIPQHFQLLHSPYIEQLDLAVFSCGKKNIALLVPHHVVD